MASGPALLCGETVLDVGLTTSWNKSAQRGKEKRTLTAEGMLNMLGENLVTEEQVLYLRLRRCQLSNQRIGRKSPPPPSGV